MEIIPGEGVALAKVGEGRDEVEARLGPPAHPGRHDKVVYNTSPMLVLTYTGDDTVEVVEIAHSGDGGEEVFLDGRTSWIAKPISSAVSNTGAHIFAAIHRKPQVTGKPPSPTARRPAAPASP